MPESEAPALRELILQLTEQCPHRVNFDACPFRKLSGLTWATRRSVLADLDLASLTLLFDLTAPCRCPSDPRRRLAATRAPS